MKYSLLLFLLMVCINSYAQRMLKPIKGASNYEEQMMRYDSLLKVKLEPDTKSFYKITEIDSLESFYIVHAERKVNNTLYYYRIKSLFSEVVDLNSKKIQIGKSYQLDLRDFHNHNQRIHFIPGVAFNLVTHMGSSDFDGVHDIVIVRDDQITQNEYNVALNLKGLYISIDAILPEQEKSEGGN